MRKGAEWLRLEAQARELIEVLLYVDDPTGIKIAGGEEVNIARVNEHTSLIDFELYGIREAGAVYLVRAGKTCLIDAGTRAEAKVIIRKLDAIGAFPPELLVLTHSHFDHTQGLPVLCREARKRGRKIAVLASGRAIPHLSDQSWNEVFDDKHPYEDLIGVTPLADGQVLDLDGLALEVIDLAGHCADDIGLYDPGNKTLFVGDALGTRIQNVVTIPPFMPPFWDPDGFRRAVDRLRRIDYERICLAHFGPLEGDEARRFVEDAIPTYETWWNLFRRADQEGRLDDVGYLKEALSVEAGIVLPDLELSKASMRVMLGLVNTFKRVLGQEPVQVAEVQMEAIVGWLAQGYRICEARA